MKTVYVSIGNSDDRLRQTDWAEFCLEFKSIMIRFGKLHGDWYSATSARWQNMCICVDIEDNLVDSLKSLLEGLKKKFRQDSIAWAEVDHNVSHRFL